MTKPIKLLTICSVATIVLLSSCTSKFGSRREADNAKREFLRGGKEVVVVSKEIDWEYQEVSAMTEKQLEKRCAVEKSWANPRNFQVFYSDSETSDIIHDEAARFVEKFCDKPLASVESFTRTNRDEENTRKCFEERETNQFVCEERKTNKEELPSDEWSKIKLTYTYFHY